MCCFSASLNCRAESTSHILGGGAVNGDPELGVATHTMAAATDTATQPLMGRRSRRCEGDERCNATAVTRALKSGTCPCESARSALRILTEASPSYKGNLPSAPPRSRPARLLPCRKNQGLPQTLCAANAGECQSVVLRRTRRNARWRGISSSMEHRLVFNVRHHHCDDTTGLTRFTLEDLRDCELAWHLLPCS